MKILILSLTLPPENSAVANIVGKLAQELSKQGCIVEGLTLGRTYQENDIKTSTNFRIYYATPPKQNCLLYPIVCLYKRILHRLPIWWKKASYHEEEVKPIVRAMESYCLNDYDVILSGNSMLRLVVIYDADDFNTAWQTLDKQYLMQDEGWRERFCFDGDLYYCYTFYGEAPNVAYAMSYSINVEEKKISYILYESFDITVMSAQSALSLAYGEDRITPAS